jgi:hypothetical protein
VEIIDKLKENCDLFFSHCIFLIHFKSKVLDHKHSSSFRWHINEFFIHSFSWLNCFQVLSNKLLANVKLKHKLHTSALKSLSSQVKSADVDSYTKQFSLNQTEGFNLDQNKFSIKSLVKRELQQCGTGEKISTVIWHKTYSRCVYKWWKFSKTR